MEDRELRRSNKHSTSDIIVKVSKVLGIADIIAAKFSRVTARQGSEEFLHETVFYIGKSSSQVSFSDVKRLITKLKNGVGCDGFHTNHM